jgi:hypothetical protein
MDERLRERHALMTRLSRLSKQTGEKAGGFTSWGEVIVVHRRYIAPLIDRDIWISPTWGDPDQAPKQLGFGHMDKVAREMKR